MINITNNASTKINQLYEEEPDSNYKLRLLIKGGGCSGLTYVFMFDTNKDDDDHIFYAGDQELLIDCMSIHYLAGSTIDYIEGIDGSKFAVINPNANNTCGCGTSFSV